jgi:hypothetical protein
VSQYRLGKIKPLEVISPKTVVLVPVRVSKLLVTKAPSPALRVPPVLEPASTSKFMVPVELQLLVGANRILLSAEAPVGNAQSVAVDARLNV